MREMIVDIFAGGGGASLGIVQALGVPVDLAINHDPLALEMHRLNHPETIHGCADVWSVDPQRATAGRPVGLAWFSPDCTHFSRAKGGKPVQKKIRSLAWVVVRWAKAVRPRVIILENVPEFREWGPLDAEDRPDKTKKGTTYNLWCNQLRGLGYQLASRELRACDYGAPTIRKRLFVIARCDGRPIVWPEPTHGEPGNLFGLTPYRTAAECIDWSIPCPSIFLSREEAKVLGIHRPLVENSLKRIARGIRKFVIESGNPFIIKYRLGATGQPLDEPMHTITAGSYIKRPAGAGHAMGLIAPYLVRCAHGETDSSGRSRWGKGEHLVGEPLPTVTASKDFALIAPTLIETGYGERAGQAPRVPGIGKPLGTVVGTGKHALVAASIVTHTTGHAGASPDAPLATVTTGDHHYALMSFLTKFYGTATGSDMREPIPTVTGGGQHIAEVRAFLVKYYGTAVGQSCREPLHTLTAKDKLGLVTVHGVDYQIADIGQRMLVPRELARAQGFLDEYILTGTKSSQVAKIGNSVCPPVAAALVRANVQLMEVGQARVEGA